VSAPPRHPHEIEIQEPALGGEPVGAVADLDGRKPVVVTPEGRIRTGRLAGLSMGKAIWVLSWPVLIESLLNTLVGLVDTTLSAGVSEAATDAIGGTAYFLWFIALVGMALGVGATALVSRAVGRGRLAVANGVVGQGAILSVVCGLSVTVMLWLIAPTAASWLRLEGDAHAAAVLYLRVCALAVPAQTFLEIGIACLRGAGDAVRPLVVMIVVNVVNLITSFVLSGVDIAVGQAGADGTITRKVIFENPFPFDLGIAGIAWGTFTAWLAGGLMITLMLAKGSHGVRLRAKRLRPHWHTMRRLIRVGMPNFLETLGMWFGNFLVVLFVGWMAIPGALGAHIVAIRIEAFSFLPGFAMSLAAATLAGQYLGAGSPRLARLAVQRCSLVAVVFMGVVGLLLAVWGKAVTGLFTQQPTHLELVPPLLIICGIVQVPFALAIVYRSAIRGAGDTTVAMWLTWFTTYAVRLPIAWLFSGVDVPLPGGGVAIHNPAPLQQWWDVHPLIGLWIGLCAELVIRGAIFTAYFLTDRWAKVRV